MEDYLKNLKNAVDCKAFGYLMPEGICPFLLYNLSPYIFTLSKGGWFSWVKRHKDVMYRKEINKYDFKKKGINSLYDNEVLVRCPNPYVNVVAGLGLWPKGNIKIRILYSDGLCLNNHKPQDELVMTSEDAAIKALNLNNAFSKTLLLSFINERVMEERQLCNIDDSIIVETQEIIFPCRYHKHRRSFGKYLLPDGFCMHIFQQVYPYVLAMMYNASADEELSLDCPVKCCVNLVLRKSYRRTRSFLNSASYALRRMFEAFFYPIDIIDYCLTIKVSDIKNKSSGCVLTKGKEYSANLKSEDFICPAAFHVLYPYLLLMAAGHTMIWQTQQDKENLMPCPDCVGIIYSASEKV